MHCEQKPEGQKTSGGYVTIDGPKVELHKPGEGRYSFSLSQLTQLAWRNQLPRWCNEVREITAHIDREFARLRAAGEDPHTKIGVTLDSVFFEDLKNATRLEISFRDLRGRRLPALFDRPEIRQQLEREIPGL